MKSKIKKIAILAFLLSTIIGIGSRTGIRGKPDSQSKVEAKAKSEKDLEFEKYKKTMMTDDYLCFSYDHVDDANKIENPETVKKV